MYAACRTCDSISNACNLQGQQTAPRDAACRLCAGVFNVYIVSGTRSDGAQQVSRMQLLFRAMQNTLVVKLADSDIAVKLADSVHSVLSKWLSCFCVSKLLEQGCVHHMAFACSPAPELRSVSVKGVIRTAHVCRGD